MTGPLTPTKITAWLDCAHYLTLSNRLAAGELNKRDLGSGGSMVQMLMDKGSLHEQRLHSNYLARGVDVFDAKSLKSHGSFEQWVERCEGLLDVGHDVVFQMPFIHDGMHGVADFLERINDPSTHQRPAYEPVDAKLARQQAKPGHILQLCFYADAIEAATDHRPESIHVDLGSGRRESVRLASVDAYWRRLRTQLDTDLTAAPTALTTAEPCVHCEFCEYQPVCERQWRDEDSLVFVAHLRGDDRHTLNAAGITTLLDLAHLSSHVEGIEESRLTRATAQAALQLRTRATPDKPPAFAVLATTDGTKTVDPVGFGLLPEPDDGDVFLDFEGHPFWQPDAELFFLFGLIEANPAGREGWSFRGWWAHSKDEETKAVKELVDYLTERRQQFPNMHVYHYNHTERSGLERLTDKHVSEVDLDVLIQTGAFVDLYRVVLGATQVGTETYSLKDAERVTGYQRAAGIEQGAGAVVEYDQWMTDSDDDRLERIRVYNEDDVRATRALRDWLISVRPDGAQWRASQFERSQPDQELDDRVRHLAEFSEDTAEHLMAELLGYWRREKRSVSSRVFVQGTGELATQSASPGTICGISVTSISPAISDKTGNELSWRKAVLTYPPQTVSGDIDEGSKMVEVTGGEGWSFFDVVGADHLNRTIDVKWPNDRDETDHPSVLVEYDWVPEGVKADALIAVADALLDGTPSPIARALLQRNLPQFPPGHGPQTGTFSSNQDDILHWASHLSGHVIPIQGPPGTGKTFTGSRIIRHLAKTCKRVGITAMSHHAIGNMVEAVIEQYDTARDLESLRLVQKTVDGRTDLDHITATASNERAGSEKFDIVAGTSWLFAHNEMRSNPVDVLIVDEAGQLGLADLIAASVSAHSLILLGDPQQLPQVAQATHPNQSGTSALKHLIGTASTVTPDRGVLLETTYRMHPDICGFISDVMYEGKLSSDASCSVQNTAEGTGLRWIEATHTDRSTESPEEAELIANEIRRLIGRDWTDQHGNTRPLTAEDFIVVAPYNHQRRRITAQLNTDPETRGVPVGTVDKFQGREAPIVFFSMTSSTQADMPRGIDFLFSLNRLNVAVSRARCVAILVSTEALMNTRARTLAEMQMVAAPNTFVERTQAS